MVNLSWRPGRNQIHSTSRRLEDYENKSFFSPPEQKVSAYPKNRSRVAIFNQLFLLPENDKRSSWQRMRGGGGGEELPANSNRWVSEELAFFLIHSFPHFLFVCSTSIYREIGYPG